MQFKQLFIKIQSVDTFLYAFGCAIILSRKVANMSKKSIFTDEQVKILKNNPYTHYISNYCIVFTFEFKQFFAEQMPLPGMTTKKIFSLAGYDVSMFSKGQLDRFRIKIRQELASETGLKPVRGMSPAERTAVFEAMDLSKQRTQTSIKELQERVVYLEQEIEFLKKISRLKENAQKKP